MYRGQLDLRVRDAWAALKTAQKAAEDRPSSREKTRQIEALLARVTKLVPLVELLKSRAQEFSAEAPARVWTR